MFLTFGGNTASMDCYFGAGKAFSLILDGEGNLYSWGSNSYGQLALQDSNQQVWSPKKVSSIGPIQKLGIGTGHCLAICCDGTTWAWGWNRFGQLGIHTEKGDKNGPFQLILPSNEPVISIAAGSYHSLILTSSGRIFSCGRSPEKDFTLEIDEDPINTLQDEYPHFVYVDAGESHNAALDIDGNVYTWGNAITGALGLGKLDKERITLPTKIQLDDTITQIVCSGRNTMVLDVNNNIWIWGDNSNRQVSNTETQIEYKPVKVQNIPPAKYIGVGGGRAAFIDIDGGLWTWGNNKFGSLGRVCSEYYDGIPTLVPDLPPNVKNNKM